jgi:hypothetical protein
VRRAVGWFQLLAGVAVLGLWTLLLLGGQVPEVQEGRVDIWFHVAAEVAMAVALVTAGLGVLRRAVWARGVSLLALGLLAYSAVNSPGYYAEQGDWAMVGMFAGVLLAAVASLAVVLRSAVAVESAEERPAGR